jgi:hypothetical protein
MQQCKPRTKTTAREEIVSAMFGLISAAMGHHHARQAAGCG